MRKKFKIISIAFILSLFLVQSVHGLTASIQPAKRIIEIEIPESPLTLIDGYYVTVLNLNDIEVDINMSASNRIVLQDESFSLQPDEFRNVYFTILLPGPGNYSEEVSAGFSASQGTPVSISSEVLIFATLGESNGTIPEISCYSTNLTERTEQLEEMVYNLTTQI